MARITIELLRKRSEHNEGCLSNLKEIALHQQDIEKIEVIGDVCRELEILYLCNNYISKIEGLRHLKWLKYLNLAINNITRIEGLEGCETLERLDLTLNFIDDLTSVRTLLANPFLETLHLTGNPCTQTEGYRAYVVRTLPQLKDLDGEEIIRADRILARQNKEDIVESVNREALKAREAQRIKAEMAEKGIDLFPPKYNEKGERVYGHTPEERLQMLREQESMESERRRKEEEPVPGSISALHKELKAEKKTLTPEEEIEKYGRLLLRNQAKVPFALDQDGPEQIVLTVEPGKFISTTLISVEVEVKCIRVSIKGKLLQIPLDVELAADKASVQRSSTTGQLKVTVPLTDEEREKRGCRTYLRYKTPMMSHEMEGTKKANKANAFAFKADLNIDANAPKTYVSSRTNQLDAVAISSETAASVAGGLRKDPLCPTLLYPHDLPTDQSKGSSASQNDLTNPHAPRPPIEELKSLQAKDVEAARQPSTLFEIE